MSLAEAAKKNRKTNGERHFLLSSSNGWNFKVYNSADKEVRNAKVQKGPNGTLILDVVSGQGLGGPIGKKFIFQNYRGQNFTTAEQYEVGGFAGGSKTDKLTCVVSEM